MSPKFDNYNYKIKNMKTTEKEQIGRELRVDERVCMCYENPKLDLSRLQEGMSDEEFTKICDEFGIPTRTRTP
jgi:hypothetical protein